MKITKEIESTTFRKAKSNAQLKMTSHGKGFRVYSGPQINNQSTMCCCSTKGKINSGMY